MKVFLDSIGCRLNQSEIETMARQLLAAGHELVSRPDEADKVILNTCAVTRAAARDARRKTRRFHRKNERAEIVLTGCYATVAPEELGAVKGAGRLVPNARKEQLVQMLDPGAGAETPSFDREPILREILTGQVGNTRAFVKVQDGCDNRCTFCITTVARGEGRSRRLGDVVQEIQGLAAAGYREAVLTGVHLGSYGHDFGNESGLRELVEAILRHTEIPRLRLSSLEPWDIDPAFFNLWEHERLLPHLHLPLQSGSDRVLRRMARRTRRDTFRELAEAAYERIPDLNLSTDIICGFPGETESDFQESLDFVREIAFSRLHVFTYSPRPGTAAAEMPDQLPKPARKERTRRMISLGDDLSLAFHRQYEGRTMNVLWEAVAGANGQGTRWIGYTDNYIRVTANGPADLFNRITPVRLFGAQADGLEGEVINA
ncbi:MAG: tRNA (N(6)-L-threonylcarbamoyladenosine(37)-C(2))-methylthiotransferase MtaB [Candidatus Promineifilaceae bacterium]|nr:tRNA (N(6)-L-threonylcarbamoyladenosine(37)-C(2))-methylthiotransferase MtaB [Candidatus Promineifilaceae bacterium]